MTKTIAQFAVAITLLLLAGDPSTHAADASEPNNQGPDTHVEGVIGAEESLGMQIEEFTLRDISGKDYSLTEFDGNPVLVIIFMGYECPLVNLYAPRIARLESEFRSQGVAVVAINSNQQDSILELKHFARKHGIEFPLLKDPGNVVADQFGAARTPEVYVLDDERRVRYRGGIDDQFGIDFRRPEPQEHYLRDAIEDLLAGREVKIPLSTVWGCHIGRVREANEDAEVTWSNQVSRMFQKRCQACHRPGEIGPFSLLTYEDTVGWQEMIREVVTNRRMPPWHANPEYAEFSNDSRLSDEEIALVEQWVQDGAPEGDSEQLPPPREWVEGWPFGEPDEVIDMADKPHPVPAEAQAEYKYFFVDPGWKEGRWVTATWCRPGNTAVVHHINVYFRPPWQSWSEWRGGMVNLVSGFLPGQSTEMTEFNGTGLYIPAGSELVFEQHYTPNGTPQEDLSSLGLQFADPADIKREALHVAAFNDKFVIPPYAASHPVKASYTFDRDSAIVFYCPHMHLRGDDFTYTAHYPDGTSEVLMEILGYDYNWQTVYWLKEHKPIPKGTRIDCLATFDNSEENLSNPDPSREVRWSGFTEDEMMVGVLGLAIPLVDGKPLEGTAPPGARIITADDTSGDLAFDRGFFLQTRTDYHTAFKFYRTAISQYWANGNLLGVLKVCLVKVSVYLGRYGGLLLLYLFAVNVAALGLWAYARYVLRYDLRRIPRRAMQLLALAGATPIAWLGQLLMRRKTSTAPRLRLGWIVTTQLVTLSLLVWFVMQRT